jgi:hypothetical protein
MSWRMGWKAQTPSLDPVADTLPLLDLVDALSPGAQHRRGLNRRPDETPHRELLRKQAAAGGEMSLEPVDFEMLELRRRRATKQQ